MVFIVPQGDIMELKEVKMNSGIAFDSLLTLIDGMSHGLWGIDHKYVSIA